VTNEEQLRRDLYASFRNRALLYHHMFDTLRKEMGEARAVEVMGRAIYARGTEIGRAFTRYAPADLAGLQLLVSEGQQLKRIVLELLDAARAEQGRLVGERAQIDLVSLAEEVCARHTADHHPCAVESNGPVIGMYDAFRITQLLENLTDNGVKYSPQGGQVRLKVWTDTARAYISVSDQGIGIPAHDLPQPGTAVRRHRVQGPLDRPGTVPASARNPLMRQRSAALAEESDDTLAAVTPPADVPCTGAEPSRSAAAASSCGTSGHSAYAKVR